MAARKAKAIAKTVWEPLQMKSVSSVDNGILMLDMAANNLDGGNNSRAGGHDYDGDGDESMSGQVSASFVVAPEVKRRLSVFAQLVGLKDYSSSLTGAESGNIEISDKGGTPSPKKEKMKTSFSEEKKDDQAESQASPAVNTTSPGDGGEGSINDASSVVSSGLSDFSAEETNQTTETVRLYRRATAANVAVRLDKLREWHMVAEALVRREITDTKLKDMIKIIQRRRMPIPKSLMMQMTGIPLQEEVGGDSNTGATTFNPIVGNEAPQTASKSRTIERKERS